jgi:hypothetical protein
MEVIEWDERGAPVRLYGEYAHDEAGQAAYTQQELLLPAMQYGRPSLKGGLNG